MRISDVLRGKGSDVVTVRPESTVKELLSVLAKHRIGAVVVSPDGAKVGGIVSERDIVRALAEQGASAMSALVASIMTDEVVCVSPDEAIDRLMQLMTTRRFRHVPILGDNGDLVGIVSIGDVVKSRLGELETERDSLATYIESAST